MSFLPSSKPARRITADSQLGQNYLKLLQGSPMNFDTWRQRQAFDAYSARQPGADDDFTATKETDFNKWAAANPLGRLSRGADAGVEQGGYEKYLQDIKAGQTIKDQGYLDIARKAGGTSTLHGKIGMGLGIANMIMGGAAVAGAAGGAGTAAGGASGGAAAGGMSAAMSGDLSAGNVGRSVGTGAVAGGVAGGLSEAYGTPTTTTQTAGGTGYPSESYWNQQAGVGDTGATYTGNPDYSLSDVNSGTGIGGGRAGEGLRMAQVSDTSGLGDYSLASGTSSIGLQAPAGAAESLFPSDYSSIAPTTSSGTYDPMEEFGQAGQWASDPMNAMGLPSPASSPFGDAFSWLSNNRTPVALGISALERLYAGNKQRQQAQDLQARLQGAFDRSDPFADSRKRAGAEYNQMLQDPSSYMSSPLARMQIDELNRATRAKQAQLGQTWSVDPQGNIRGSGTGAVDFASQLQYNLARQYETALGNRAQQAGMSMFPSSAMMQSMAQVPGLQADAQRQMGLGVGMGTSAAMKLFPMLQGA